MTVQAYIFMTQEQRDVATALDDDSTRLGAQLISNPMANDLGLGTIVGIWVTPARLLDDPEYIRWVPILASLPNHTLDGTALFSSTSDN